MILPANVKLCFHFSDLLSEAIDSLGGYYSDIFTDHDDDAAHILADVHNKVGDDNLNIETAQKKLGCLKINKVEELVVNENSSLRDLNIAVLMTHWDYISMVYYHR